MLRFVKLIFCLIILMMSINRIVRIKALVKSLVELENKTHNCKGDVISANMHKYIITFFEPSSAIL